MAKWAGARVLVLLCTLFLLPACAQSMPADPEGTLERVTGGTLRVGASDNGDWVSVDPTREPEGSEAELLREFAGRLGASIEWTTGSEQVLAEELKHGELDVVIGGLDDKTPWEKHAGLTLPYTESKDERGETHKHVMLVRKGENAFLLELDRFLAEAEQSP
ncbi:transporter substrate-binding domain-containing protein [Arthrobacter rhizosphaerae]|uniref:transporter substrate-binding domain-containing protein n=1 Tax=Arthrobacter rhizosphaerae TaxID=2855490 RepID=UPI001FF4BE12|nr:transporter substrate-binding domain-containing protein [Arthrobacter rhizosphaerae]